MVSIWECEVINNANINVATEPHDTHPDGATEHDSGLHEQEHEETDTRARSVENTEAPIEVVATGVESRAQEEPASHTSDDRGADTTSSSIGAAVLHKSRSDRRRERRELKVQQRKQEVRQKIYNHVYDAAYSPEPFSLLRNCLWTIGVLMRAGDPEVRIRTFKFNKSEVSASSFKWLERIKIFEELWMICVGHGAMDEEELEILKGQLFPTDSKDIADPTFFRVFIADFVKHGLWCNPTFGEKIVELQTTREEHDLGPLVDAPEPMSRVYTDFERLPVGDKSRSRALTHLIEATVYECPEWKGVRYGDATRTFELYYAAWRLSRTGTGDPYPLEQYYRDWTYDEERLLRAGFLVLKFLRRVNEGDFSPLHFRDIRSTFFRVPFQPHCRSDEFGGFLYNHANLDGSDQGIAVADIPRLLVLHPDLKFCCELEELERYNEFLETAQEFEEEERLRLQQIEEAKVAFTKKSRSKFTDIQFTHNIEYQEEHANNVLVKRFARRIRSVLKNMVGKKEQTGFHCIGCLQGHPCIG